MSTLVAISLERYFAICHPLTSRRWQTLSHAYRSIAVVWCVSLVAMVPIGVTQQLRRLASGSHKCVEVWAGGVWERVYTVFLVGLLLLAPLILMLLAYGCISATLCRGIVCERPPNGEWTDRRRTDRRGTDCPETDRRGTDRRGTDRPGNRPPGDRPPGDRPPGDRPPGDRPPGEQPAEGPTAGGPTTLGNNRRRDRPPRDRPPGEQPAEGPTARGPTARGTLSPCRPVTLSPRRTVTPSPCRPVTLSPRSVLQMPRAATSAPLTTRRVTMAAAWRAAVTCVTRMRSGACAPSDASSACCSSSSSSSSSAGRRSTRSTRGSRSTARPPCATSRPPP